MHRLKLSLGILSAIAGLIFVSAAPAAAYGNGAAYQVGLSLNCQDQVACVAGPTNPFGIGGFWGWITIDQNGNVDGQLEAQGHDNANAAFNGAQHISLNGFAVPTTQQFPFIPTDPNGRYLLIFQQGIPFPFFEIEATGGHYQLKSGPGISTNIQVSQLP